MKIMIVPSFFPTPSLPLRGIFFQHQARVLADVEGLEVTVVVLECRSLKEVSLAAVRKSHFQDEVRVVDGLVLARRKGWNPMTATITGGRVFAALLRRHLASVISSLGPPDVIHAHNALWGGYAAAEMGGRFAIPVVVTEHDSAFIERQRGVRCSYAKAAWQSADAVIAVGGSLGRNVAAISEREVRVIPNMVETNFFTPVPRETSGGFSFLSVGNLVPVKGFDVLIAAFAAAFRHAPATVLRIVGDGPDRNVLVALTEKCGVAGQITFRGALDREGVRDEMRHADAFVSSSRVETFGIAVAEAMACGLPIVATRSGAPEEFVGSDAGILVEPDDREALAAALVRMRREAAAFDRDAVRESVTRRFSEAVVAAQIGDVYRSVLAEKQVIA
jgi:glycosyltransferase involved in cell wall biosynthesis